ncbi:MAG: nucleotidyltransferase domain-containing protein [Nanoarchaeota archaeon]
MITKVNDTDLRVLSLFTKGYDREYYIREVEKLLEVSSRTALVTLEKLEQRGILESKSKGKIKAYAIKKSFLAKEFFILTEYYKKIRFLEKNHLIKEILEKADVYLKGMVIIFGSFSKGLPKDDSDLDLFITGTFDEDKIKEAGMKYGIKVNIKKYPMKVFENNIHDDFLLKEIADDHIVVKDAEGFVRRVLRWIR